jgi:hypothetical protein
MASNDRMINNELERMWKEAFVASRNYPRGTEEHH